MPTKTQLLVRRGEAVAAAAHDQLAVVSGGDPLALEGLPAASKSTQTTATDLAEMYERWAADIARRDPLLSRAVRELASALRASADQARAVRREAVDALESLVDEDS